MMRDDGGALGVAMGVGGGWYGCVCIHTCICIRIRTPRRGIHSSVLQKLIGDPRETIISSLASAVWYDDVCKKHRRGQCDWPSCARYLTLTWDLQYEIKETLVVLRLTQAPPTDAHMIGTGVVAGKMGKLVIKKQTNSLVETNENIGFAAASASE